ncbi:MAG: flagellar export protein FliJ [Ignavibacteriaceae bacterium]|jgi:flagellar FliJ protein|nr:flagellar export protein FliJ [Ignavibacteriaceae bacterium]
MSKFNYKFETVRKIKESLEKKAQKEVAEIDLAIGKLKTELQSVLVEEEEHRKKFSTNIRISDLKAQKGYLVSLKKKMENIQLQINALNIQREKKVTELIQKSKEHKIFDSLEDIYRDQFNEEEKRLDMVQVNETATQRFVREKK